MIEITLEEIFYSILKFHKLTNISESKYRAAKLDIKSPVMNMVSGHKLQDMTLTYVKFPT